MEKKISQLTAKGANLDITVTIDEQEFSTIQLFISYLYNEQ